jgi:hypothetical protein
MDVDGQDWVSKVGKVTEVVVVNEMKKVGSADRSCKD